MDNLASASGTPRNGNGRVSVDQCCCGPEADLPISISRSKRPGRLRAGSIAFGRFVVATTTTRPVESSCIPSINVSRVATTRFSTSPPGPSSRFGHKASTSSRTMIHGLLARAWAKTALNLDSVSPWYAEDSSGPLTTIMNELVADEMARARWVFPVPGGPWSRTPRGGLRPGEKGRRSGGIHRGDHEMRTEMSK
jgi:hypothetical protein